MASNTLLSLTEKYIAENGSITTETYNQMKAIFSTVVESVSDAKECVNKIRDLQKKMKDADKSEEEEYTEKIRELSAKFSDLKEDIPEDKKKEYEDLEAELSELLGKVDDSKKTT